MVETVNKPSLNRSAKERRNTQTLRSHSKVTVIALSIYLMFPFHVPHEISNLKQTTEKAQPQEEESVYEGVIGSILFSIMAVTVLMLVFVYVSSSLFGVIELSSESVILAVTLSLAFSIAAALAIMSGSKSDKKKAESTKEE